MSTVNGKIMEKMVKNYSFAVILLINVIILNRSIVNCDINYNKTNNNSSVPVLACINDEYCSKSIQDQLVLAKSINKYHHNVGSSGKSFNTERLKHSSVLYGLVMNAEKHQLNHQCFSELMQIYEGINKKEIWAIKILDASGHMQAGFTLGHNNWLGSQKGCQAVQQPLQITLSNRFERLMNPNLLHSVAPFDVDYRMVYFKHTSPWQVEIKFLSENVLHIGLCLPNSCRNSEIHNLTQEYFNSRISDSQEIFDFDGDVILVKDLKLRNNFFTKKSVIIASVVFSLVFFVVLASWNRDEQINNLTNETPSNDTTIIPPSNSFWDKLLRSFSIKNNWKVIMDDTIAKDSIPVINGLKSISAFMILLFHVLWFSFYTISNPGVVFNFSEQIRFQFIANAALMVDVFFTISGFLVTYNFLRNRARMIEIENNNLFKNIKLFGKLLMHRYIRLSPLYLMVNLLTEVFTSYIVDTSKFWVHERSDLNCQQYWWRNILYIQNLFHVDELCGSWTWSMACEMQFFIVFTIIMFIYAKNKDLGRNVFWTFSGIIFAIGTYQTFKKEFVPSFDVLYNTATDLYTAPWVRVTPYIVGVGCGYYLQNYKEQIKIKNSFRSVLYMLSTFFFILVLHCSIKRDVVPVVASFFIVLGRPILGLCVSWFIISNAVGYSCWVSNLLSAKVFVRVNKLTYAIYLLNPIIITVFTGSFDNGTLVDPMVLFILMLGISVVTYILSIFFSLFFEIPYYKLSNELLKRVPVAHKKD
ncbi:unnamed protein product [Diamesa serratosioi]